MMDHLTTNELLACCCCCWGCRCRPHHHCCSWYCCLAALRVAGCAVLKGRTMCLSSEQNNTLLSQIIIFSLHLSRHFFSVEVQSHLYTKQNKIKVASPSINNKLNQLTTPLPLFIDSTLLLHFCHCPTTPSSNINYIAMTQVDRYLAGTL